MPEDSEVPCRQSQAFPNLLTGTARSKQISSAAEQQGLTLRGREVAIVSLWDFSLWNVGLRGSGSQRSDYFWSQWMTWEDLILLSSYIVTNTTETRFLEVLFFLVNRGLCHLENRMFWNVIMFVYTCLDCILSWKQWKFHFYVTELLAFRLETGSPSNSISFAQFVRFLCSLGLWKLEGQNDCSINSLRVRVSCKLVCGYRHIWVSVSPEPIFKYKK